MITDEELMEMNLEELKSLLERVKKQNETVRAEIKEKQALINKIKRQYVWLNKNRNSLSYTKDIKVLNLWSDNITNEKYNDEYDNETKGYIKRYSKTKQETEE